MVERTVLMKLKDDLANDAGRSEIASRLTRDLPGVPGVRGVSVQLPADPRSAKDWDLCLRVSFDSVEDVERYRVDPTHRALVDDFLLPRLEVIKAWNFAPAGS